MVQGVDTMLLGYTGSQIAALTKGFSTEMGLRIPFSEEFAGRCVASLRDERHFNTVQRICRG